MWAKVLRERTTCGMSSEERSSIQDRWQGDCGLFTYRSDDTVI